VCVCVCVWWGSCYGLRPQQGGVGTCDIHNRGGVPASSICSETLNRPTSGSNTREGDPLPDYGSLGVCGQCGGRLQVPIEKQSHSRLAELRSKIGCLPPRAGLKFLFYPSPIVCRIPLCLPKTRSLGSLLFWGLISGVNYSKPFPCHHEVQWKENRFVELCL
jgi:hypothetical protein